MRLAPVLKTKKDQLSHLVCSQDQAFLDRCLCTCIFLCSLCCRRLTAQQRRGVVVSFHQTRLRPSRFYLPLRWHGLNLPPALHSRSLDRNAYALRLDSSVDVSVVLQDMKPASGPGSVESLDLKEIFSRTPSGAPGKFYNSEAGSVLLGTLKTGGPCARVGLLPGEDEEHELNWEKLRDRLENKHMVSHAFLSV